MEKLPKYNVLFRVLKEFPKNGQMVIDDQTGLQRIIKFLVPTTSTGYRFYLSRDLALWPHFTVYKNIAFGLDERKGKNVKKTVFQMLDFFGLSEHAEKFPHQLSGGQKQM